MFSVRHNSQKHLDFAGVRLQVCIVNFSLLLLHSLFICELFYVSGYTGTCVTVTIRMEDSEATNW
jgi:hypothetical protein